MNFILFLPLERKIHIFSPPCNILYLFYGALPTVHCSYTQLGKQAKWRGGDTAEVASWPFYNSRKPSIRTQLSFGSVKGINEIMALISILHLLVSSRKRFELYHPRCKSGKQSTQEFLRVLGKFRNFNELIKVFHPH